MSKGDKPSGGVFEIDRIQQIVELMKEHDLSEVDLQQGTDKIKLTRGGVAPLAVAAPVAPAPVAAAPAAAPAAAGAGTSGTSTINAPMVGTFYAKANPESPPFVKVGDVVSEDTVVCIVEAMKVFNEIPAEMSGKIVAVLVEEGAAVEHGQKLFKVEAG